MVPDLNLVYPLSTEQAGRYRGLIHQSKKINLSIHPYLASIKLHQPVAEEMFWELLERVVDRHEILRSRLAFPDSSVTPFQEIRPPSIRELLILPKVVGYQTIESTLDGLEQLWRGEGGIHAIAAAVFREGDSGDLVLVLLLSPEFGDLPTLRIIASDICELLQEITEMSSRLQSSPVQYVEVLEYIDEHASQRQQSSRTRDHIVRRGLQWRGFQAEENDVVASITQSIEFNLATVEQIFRGSGQFGVSLDAILMVAAQIAWARLHSDDSAACAVIIEGRHEEELESACGPYALFRVYQGVGMNVDVSTLKNVWAKITGKKYKPVSLQNEGTCLVFECGLGNRAQILDAELYLQLHGLPAAHGEIVVAFGHLSNQNKSGVLILTSHSDTTTEGALDNFGQLIIQVIAELVGDDLDKIDLLSGDACTELTDVLQHALTVDDKRIVLRSSHGEFSVRQLRDFVNRVGTHLAALNPQPGDVVVLIDHPSFELVGAMVACMLAGVTFSIIEPSLPLVRKEVILNSLTPIQILSGKGVLSQEEETELQVHTLSIKSNKKKTILWKQARDPEDTAYVLFTSGSTGQPKGVQITRRALANFITWMHSSFALAREERVLVTSAPGFDVFFRETLWPIVAGATLVLPDTQGDWLQSQSLAELCAQENISQLRIVPALMAEFVRDSVKLPKCVVRFSTGGEAVPTELLRSFHDLNPIPFIVFYGPTETTINVACWKGGGNFMPHYAPLGKSIAGAILLVLDKQLHPVHEGTSGQLGIGGLPLARGFWKQDALECESFHNITFNHQSVRIYLTGDHVRRLPDGNLEFLGRLDDQVKVRGYRVELEGISHVLRQQAGVVDALVLAEGEGEQVRLLGYVLPAEKASDALQLRDALRQELPEYMIPAAIVGIDQWPLTRNGKIDRRALPRTELHAGGEGGLPSTVDERQLLEIWSEVLGLEGIGVEESFFDLGGHSLLAMQLIARMREEGLQINLRQFFSMPTIGKQAQFFKAQERVVHAPTIEMVPREELLPLSMAQNRLWVLDQLAPGNPVYNIPIALQLGGPLHVAALRAALEEIVNRHEVLRANFIDEDGEPFMRVRTQSEVPFECIEYGGKPSELQACLTAYARQPFNLRTDALIRCHLLKQDESHHILLLVVHHIIFDGWSISVLETELRHLYTELSEGRAASLPPLPYQYVDYAQWKRSQLVEQGVLERQQNYWRKKLADAPGTYGIPPDLARPAMQSFKGAEHAFEIAVSTLQGLEALAKRYQVTLFSVTLAAFATLLARRTGRHDVVLGTDLIGRRVSQSERLLGFFVRNVPLRLRVEPESDFGSWLVQVHDEIVDVLDQPIELEFDQIVDAVRPRRDSRRNPIFQTLFALHEELEDLSWPSLEVSHLSIDSGTSPFDFSLHLTPQGSGMQGLCRYATDLYMRLTITDLCYDYVELLEKWACEG